MKAVDNPMIFLHVFGNASIERLHTYNFGYTDVRNCKIPKTQNLRNHVVLELVCIRVVASDVTGQRRSIDSDRKSPLGTCTAQLDRSSGMHGDAITQMGGAPTCLPAASTMESPMTCRKCREEFLDHCARRIVDGRGALSWAEHFSASSPTPPPIPGRIVDAAEESSHTAAFQPGDSKHKRFADSGLD
ncbi:hypothetical protein ANO11243_046020 [Dothideomycetidae sp. 11243]|nr:hypothetical protein ANO11243_046020 [fungal sp. No.11243]